VPTSLEQDTIRDALDDVTSIPRGGLLHEDIYMNR
jgi:hypothetical protein